jgi:hypothetical protein
VRVLIAITAAAMVLFAGGYTARTAHPAASPAPLPPDPHTTPALLKIAAAFNHDYDTGDYGPVYTRWDTRSQAINSAVQRGVLCVLCPPSADVRRVVRQLTCDI